MGALLLGLAVLLVLVSACVRPASPPGSGPAIPPGPGEASPGDGGEEGNGEDTPLVIKSENPVLADSRKVLEELEKEVAELLKILDSMDTVDSNELTF